MYELDIILACVLFGFIVDICKQILNATYFSNVPFSVTYSDCMRTIKAAKAIKF